MIIMLLLLPLLFCVTSARNETSGADGLPPDCEWSTEEGHVHCRGVPAQLIENRLAGARPPICHFTHHFPLQTGVWCYTALERLRAAVCQRPLLHA